MSDDTGIFTTTGRILFYNNWKKIVGNCRFLVPNFINDYFISIPPFSCVLITTDEASATGGRKANGVGFMKDKELKLQETEASHTLGGAGESHVQGRGKGIGCKCYCPVRYTIINRSRRTVARRAKFRLRKKPMNLCACVSEDRGHGVGVVCRWDESGEGVDATVSGGTVPTV